MSRTLTPEEFSGADFRDAPIYEFVISEDAMTLSFMCGWAVLGTGEALDCTCGVNLWLARPVQISERRKSFEIAVQPGFARDLGAIAEFSVAEGRLFMAGPDNAEHWLIYRGDIERLEGWSVE